MNVVTTIIFFLFCTFLPTGEYSTSYISFNEGATIYGSNSEDICLGIWQGVYVLPDRQNEDLLNYLADNSIIQINGQEVSLEYIHTLTNAGMIREYDAEGNLIGTHAGDLILCVDRIMFSRKYNLVRFQVPDDSRNYPHYYLLICNCVSDT